MGDPVSLLLDKQDLACEFGAFRPPLEHLLEQLRRPERVPTGLREQVEESAVFGDEGERQGAKLPRLAPLFATHSAQRKPASAGLGSSGLVARPSGTLGSL